MNTQPPGFPPVVVERVARFLAAGCTGTIELQVQQGRIRGFKVIEAIRFGEGEPPSLPSSRLDDNGRTVQDSDS